MTWAAALLAAALGSSAVATPDLASEVQKLLPGAQIIEIADGDLDGDGAADVVALVRGPVPEESFLIVVLRAQAQGFIEWARSADVGPFPKGLPSLSIQRRAILFETGAATCCERSTEHHQFQWRDGRFRWIGATVAVTSGGAANARHALSKVDFNLLTGDREEQLVQQGRKTQVRKSRETLPSPRWLDSFSGLLGDRDLDQVLTARLH